MTDPTRERDPDGFPPIAIVQGDGWDCGDVHVSFRDVGDGLYGDGHGGGSGAGHGYSSGDGEGDLPHD